MNTERKRLKWWLGAAAVFVFGFVCAYLFLPPKVSLTAQQRGADTEFGFSTRGVNGLLGLRIWRPDTRELLWDVRLNYYNGASLKYGEVPAEFETFNGATNRATQNFPSYDAKPSQLPSDARLIVALDCQYDKFVAAAVQTFYFSLTTDSAGNVSHVSRVEFLNPDEYPKQK